MPKLSPELDSAYVIAPRVRRMAFIHPILGEVDLETAPKKLGAKLLKAGYLLEKPVKVEAPEKPSKRIKKS
jgi:hypothetical protein